MRAERTSRIHDPSHRLRRVVPKIVGEKAAIPNRQSHTILTRRVLAEKQVGFLQRNAGRRVAQTLEMFA
jgi:hypothetical protein